MILSALLVLLAIFGAPLFTVIAASAMLGYQREGIDLMAIAIEKALRPSRVHRVAACVARSTANQGRKS